MLKIINYPLLFVLTCLLMSCQTMNLFQTNEHKDPTELISEIDSLLFLAPGDKVTLSVWQHDDLSVGSVFNIYNANESFGKWVMVSEDSTVNLPSLGTFDVRFKTTQDLENTIVKALNKEIVNPVVVVKVLNREVTILGEVRTPGNFILDKEKTSIVEVLGKAEGFMSYADVSHVQLIRNGESYLIDMSTLNTPFASKILVKPGDIIAVPSLRGKRLDQKAPTIIPFASAATSIAVLLSLIFN